MQWEKFSKRRSLTIMLSFCSKILVLIFLIMSSKVIRSFCVDVARSEQLFQSHTRKCNQDYEILKTVFQFTFMKVTLAMTQSSYQFDFFKIMAVKNTVMFGRINFKIWLLKMLVLLGFFYFDPRILFIQFMYNERKEQFFEKLKFYPKFFILIVSEVCTIYPEAATRGVH